MLIYPIPVNVCFRLVQIQMFSISHLAFRVSHSIDICTVAIKNIKNMHAVSTNQMKMFCILMIRILKSCVKVKLKWIKMVLYDHHRLPCFDSRYGERSKSKDQKSLLCSGNKLQFFKYPPFERPLCIDT